MFHSRAALDEDEGGAADQAAGGGAEPAAGGGTVLSGVEEARKEIDASGQIKDVNIACPIIVFTMQPKCQSFASQYFSAHYYYSKKHNSSHTVNKLGYVQIKCSKLDHLCSVTLKLPPLIVAYSDEKCSLVVLVFPPNTCVLLSASSLLDPFPLLPSTTYPNQATPTVGPFCRDPLPGVRTPLHNPTV